VLQLLERNVSQRLGCRPNGQGFHDIKNSPWLQGVDWESMETKEAQPFFVPDVSIVIYEVCLVLTPCR
jgi:serine/threonine kinase 32